METLVNPSTADAAVSDYLEADASVDNVDTVMLISDQGQDVNGFVFKANPSAETGYGKGQAFMVLEEGTGDATDQTASGSVMFRVDRHGNVGFTGGLHVATGMRWDDPAITQAAWIDPSDNMIGLVITNPTVAEAATHDKDFIQINDVRTDPVTNYFKVTSAGLVQASRNIMARTGSQTTVSIGDAFGFPAIAFGDLADTLLFRQSAGVVRVSDILQFVEKADPAAPAGNNVRLYARDNGAGKTQLCARFATGAVQVLATEP